MISRCYTRSHSVYRHYGGRGIKVCARWREPKTGFWNFVEDMGIPAEGLWIDRIDNDGDYTPENCRWATPTEQNNGRRDTVMLTHNGVTKPLNDWAREYGLSGDTLRKRIYKVGWSVDKALTTPLRRRWNWTPSSWRK